MSVPAPPRPATVTVTDLARDLVLKPESVRRLINDGRIAAVKVGAHWRIPVAERDRLVGLEVG